MSSFKLWLLRSNTQQAAILKLIQFYEHFVSEKKNLTNSNMNLYDNFRLVQQR